MRYVALLRGINVGGANKVDMKQLKAVFEAAGLSAVRTYINSGNVLFTAEADDRAELTARLEKDIRDRFGFAVGVLLRDGDEMRAITEAIPQDWADNKDMKCDVLFLWEDIDDPAILEQLPYDAEMEDVFYVPGAVVRRVDRKNAAKSKLTRIVGTPIYKRITIRNCNTARKLLVLMESEG
ncbi:MAG: DUF1697 domain-containing protein [Coriobacteriales bacterium]|nr:DUF1697 domain-containing protein [Coriobacteriales bacterium]